ncbi:GntR family transcriptional regulator [Labrys monachus]|uniref:DNA-binding GntR family transcriptional regulator n=1 Tax=Labrys monachus TaxID=217067 RepID=A0ABU0FHD4_9HYPH|nr:GntR family transcriptional regulator [Labrys monachus]MDQ0393886.1 DNA-binding GntR family transcriptional regulator [Labrys monachus]
MTRRPDPAAAEGADRADTAPADGTAADGKTRNDRASAKPALDGAPTPLVRRLLSYIVSEGLAEGAHLAEQTLADALQVSRTPIRKALMDLAREGIVQSEARRGYFLARPARSLFAASLDFPALTEDDIFDRIAIDHLDGELPDLFSKRDVVTRYDVSTRLAERAIQALVDEKVIVQDQPGSWKFNPFMLTAEASIASYAYRLAIEPNILLLPSFEVRRDLIRACRDEHIRFLTLRPAERTARLAFKVDVSFHESIATCGGNHFFHSSVVQHNRMRQLLEYRDSFDEERMLVWLKEHLDIMEAVAARDLAEASDLMRTHLTNALRHREANLARHRRR